MSTQPSQGVAAHQAGRWPSAYDGTGVRVGIIDVGFDHFADLMRDGELPPAARVRQRCYDSDRNSVPSGDINDCTGGSHGSTVAEALIDVAEGVTLYISNATRLMDPSMAMRRTKEDVAWMVREGVDVINHSVYWGLSEGLGDGVPRYTMARDERDRISPLETIDSATRSGILWVNIAGNEHQRIWYGPFKDTGRVKNNIHNYALTDECNYITIDPTDPELFVEMRWDDSWGRADCDLDLYLYREEAAGHIRLVDFNANSQGGAAGQYSYESVEAPVLPGKYYVTIKKFPSRSRIDPCANTGWLQLLVWGPHTLEHSATDTASPFREQAQAPGH